MCSRILCRSCGSSLVAVTSFVVAAIHLMPCLFRCEFVSAESCSAFPKRSLPLAFAMSNISGADLQAVNTFGDALRVAGISGDLAVALLQKAGFEAADDLVLLSDLEEATIRSELSDARLAKSGEGAGAGNDLTLKQKGLVQRFIVVVLRKLGKLECPSKGGRRIRPPLQAATRSSPAKRDVSPKQSAPKASVSRGPRVASTTLADVFAKQVSAHSVPVAPCVPDLIARSSVLETSVCQRRCRWDTESPAGGLSMDAEMEKGTEGSTSVACVPDGRVEQTLALAEMSAESVLAGEKPPLDTVCARQTSEVATDSIEPDSFAGLETFACSLSRTDATAAATGPLDTMLGVSSPPAAENSATSLSPDAASGNPTSLTDGATAFRKRRSRWGVELASAEGPPMEEPPADEHSTMHSVALAKWSAQRVLAGGEAPWKHLRRCSLETSLSGTPGHAEHADTALPAAADAATQPSLRSPKGGLPGAMDGAQPAAMEWLMSDGVPRRLKACQARMSEQQEGDVVAAVHQEQPGSEIDAGSKESTDGLVRRGREQDPGRDVFVLKSQENGRAHDTLSISELVKHYPEGDPLVVKEKYIQPLRYPGQADHGVCVVPKWARKLKKHKQGNVCVYFTIQQVHVNGSFKARQKLKRAITRFADTPV